MWCSVSRMHLITGLLRRVSSPGSRLQTRRPTSRAGPNDTRQTAINNRTFRQLEATLIQQERPGGLESEDLMRFATSGTVALVCFSLCTESGERGVDDNNIGGWGVTTTYVPSASLKGRLRSDRITGLEMPSGVAGRWSVECLRSGSPSPTPVPRAE